MLMRGIFPMKHKRSSAIVGLGHDRRTSTLAVRWRSGNVSFHYMVPRELFADFLGAESLGKFFRERVRGKFTKSLHEAGRGTSPLAHTPGIFSQRQRMGYTASVQSKFPPDYSTATVSQRGNPETRFEQ
jgi:hypothetical protein